MEGRLMSKPKRQHGDERATKPVLRLPETTEEIAPITQVESDAPPQDPMTIELGESDVPLHRRCPLCWEGNKGIGKAYSKQGRTRYYKCARTLRGAPPCGFTWTATVKIEVTKVEHRIVELDGER